MMINPSTSWALMVSFFVVLRFRFIGLSSSYELFGLKGKTALSQCRTSCARRLASGARELQKVGVIAPFAAFLLLVLPSCQARQSKIDKTNPLGLPAACRRINRPAPAGEARRDPQGEHNNELWLDF